MENGAEEPEQSETSAEIRKSADLEDATTTNSSKGEDVHQVVEDVINEQGLDSNGEELMPPDENIVTKVTENDLSVSTLDSEGDSESARILEDHSDAGVDGIDNASTVSREYATDGVEEEKEPENETENSSSLESNGTIAVETNRNEKLPTSHEELSKESDNNEILPTSHEEFFKENSQTNELPSRAEFAQNFSGTEIGDVELPTTNNKLTTEVNAADASPSAEGDIEPAPADDEQTTDEGVALETPSTTDSAAPVAVEQDSSVDSFTAIEEPTKGATLTDELAVTPATVEKTGIEDEDVEPEEALLKQNEEDEARFNQETPEAVTVVKDEAAYGTENDEENAGVENTELDPATADAELVKDESSTDEVPCSTKSTEPIDEEESVPVRDQVYTDVSLSDEIPSTAESAKATTVEDEKDLAPFVATEELAVDEGLADNFPRAGSALEHDEGLESGVPHVDTVPDEIASAPEATEADPVDDDRNVDHDEGLESAAPVEHRTPDELASTPESTEVTPVEDATTVDHDEALESVAPSEDTKPDELVSVPESTEATPVEDAKNVEPVEGLLKEEIVAEAIEATTVEDEKGVAPRVESEELTMDDGLADKFPGAFNTLEHDDDLDSVAPLVDTVPDEIESAPESTKANLVEDAEIVDHDENLESAARTDDTKLDELASTAESTEVTPVDYAQNDDDVGSEAPVEDKMPDELASTPESTEVTPIGDANNLNHDEDLEPVAPNDDTEPDELVLAPGTAEASPVENVKEHVKDLLKEESVADGNISTAPIAQSSPAVEDKGTKGQASHEELAKENTEELVEGSPVEDAKDPEAKTADEELNQGDNLADEIMLPTESAEANPAVEDKDMESVTLSEELAKDDTAGDSLAPVLKSPEIIPDDHATDVEPLTANELTKDEDQEEKVSTDFVEDISTIEPEDGEASIPHDELAREGTVANESGHNLKPDEDREHAEPKTVDEDRNLGDSLTNETILPTGSAEAIPVVGLNQEKLASETTDSDPIVDDEHVETPTPSEELTNETATDELSPAGNAGEFIPVDDAYDSERVNARGKLDKVEVLGDEIPLTDKLPEKVVDASAPHDELANREATDEVAQIPDSHEASPVEHTTDAELVTGDEGVTDEDNAADEMSLFSDSSDATFVVDGEDLESPQDVEAPTSHEELAQEVIVTDESSPGPESGDTASVADSQAEGPFAVDEVASEDTESTSTVEDVEASTSQEELAKEGTADAAVQSAESGEATPAEHGEDGELVIDEKVENSADAIPAIEDQNVEAATLHEELTEEGTTDELAQHRESGDATLVYDAKDEEPSKTNSADAIPAIEDQNVEAATLHEELTEKGTTDEVAQHPESGDATLVYDAKDEEPIITDDGVNKEESIADETLVSTDSANAITAVEDKDLEALTSPEELAKDVEAVPDDSGVASESGGATSAVEDEVVDASTPHEQLVKEETMGDESQSPYSVEGSLVDDAKDGEPVTGEREVNKEALAEEVPFTADAKDSVPVSEDNHVDVPPPHEEVVEKDTTDQAAQSLESCDAALVEDVKYAERVTMDEDVNKALSTAKDVETSLITDSDVMVSSVEEKNVEAPTSHEELVTEENVDDVYQSLEPVEAGPFVDAEDGTGDEGSIKEENGADERPLMTDSANAIPAAEDEDVDTPTRHEELGSEETVPDDLGRSSKDGEAIPVEDAEPVTEAENVKMEQSTIQEALTTGSPEMTNAVEDDVVEAPTPLEELAKEDTEPSESPPAPESEEVSSVVEDDDVQPMIPTVLKKDIEVPVTHEQLAQEDMVAHESPSVPEFPVVTPSEENRDFDSSIDKEEFTEDKSLPDEVTLGTDSSEGIAASEAKDESAIPHQEPGGMNTATQELPSTYEVADDAAIDDDVDALSRELAAADEEPSDEPAQAVVTEAEKYAEPAIANEELMKSEVAPTNEELCTEESEANVIDLAAEPTEIVDKHMVTSDSPGKLQRNPPLTYFDDHNNGISNDAVQPVVTEESPETKEATNHTFSSANGDKVAPLLEETQKLALTREGVASDGDDILEKIVENADPAVTADLGTATLDTQGHEAHVVNNLHSAVLTPSTSKAIETCDLDPGLLKKRQEKVQNVAQDPEEDTTSVPLSTYSTDLSSSWVSVSQIQDADSQSASTRSRIHVSQKSQSRRPDDELVYGRDDWRIVSEQDISALKTNDLDTESSGTKFPFSIILWCSQSMASLFGGAKD